MKSLIRKKALLFKKNISNYLIGIYKELYKEINIIFKAIFMNIITGTDLKDYILILIEIYK